VKQVAIVLLLAHFLSGCALADRLVFWRSEAPEVEVWLTNPDQSALLERQPSLRFAQGEAQGDVIMVDPETRYQEIVGFGAAITDASAFLIQNKLNDEQRADLLADLFGPPPGVNFSFTRIVIGASDFSSRHYSFDDLPEGETDPALERFSIAPAKQDVLPTLRAARAINPDLEVMATLWSAPGWMKTSGSLIKGALREETYAVFAQYLRRTLEDFADEGASIEYISIQNEPDFEPADYPGMRLSAEQRAAIIGDHVGPEFAKAGLATKILDWDHNWDQPQQPLGVLGDAEADRYVSGVAWHCYAGDVSAQSAVRDKHPDKDVFFTECSGGEWSKAWPDAWAWIMRNLVIGSTRNWARGVLMWNLALDENFGPHLGGCGNCRGVVTIDSATGEVTRNPEYYALGHVSRFVRKGAWRIASESRNEALMSVAFADSDGARILVVFNAGDGLAGFSVQSGAHLLSYELAPKAAATFRWKDR
jgi:glucosylceramidase